MYVPSQKTRRRRIAVALLLVGVLLAMGCTPSTSTSPDPPNVDFAEAAWIDLDRVAATALVDEGSLDVVDNDGLAADDITSLVVEDGELRAACSWFDQEAGEDRTVEIETTTDFADRPYAGHLYGCTIHIDKRGAAFSFLGADGSMIGLTYHPATPLDEESEPDFGHEADGLDRCWWIETDGADTGADDCDIGSVTNTVEGPVEDGPVSVEWTGTAVLRCEYWSSRHLRAEFVFLTQPASFGGTDWNRTIYGCALAVPANADAQIVFRYLDEGSRMVHYSPPPVGASDGASLVVTPDQAAPGGTGWVLHADGTRQAVSETCRSRLENRGLTAATIDPNVLQLVPVGPDHPCESVYGGAVLGCPSGSTGTTPGSPPAQCDGPDYRAQWIDAASGGEVRLGDYSLVVPAGALSRSCYGSITVIQPEARLADFELHCPWTAPVTIVIPHQVIADLEPSTFVSHFKDGVTVDEPGRVLADGRLAAGVDSLSAASWQRIGTSLAEGGTCVVNVLNTLSIARRILLGPAANGWAVAVCGTSLGYKTYGEQAFNSIGSDVDITTYAKGDGPKDAAKHCSWSAAITRAFGPTVAVAVTDSHELLSSGLPRQMDLSNNAVGRYVGQNSSSIQDAISRCVGRARGERGGEILWVFRNGDSQLMTTADYRTWRIQQQTPAPPPPPPPPPPPGKSVTLSKGGSAQGQPGCTSSACRFLQVNTSGFGGGSHQIRCFASAGDEGGWWTYNTASTSSSNCYYGFPGRDVWVTVDGVRSNTVRW